MATNAKRSVIANTCNENIRVNRSIEKKKKKKRENDRTPYEFTVHSRLLPRTFMLRCLMPIVRTGASFIAPAFLRGSPPFFFPLFARCVFCSWFITTTISTKIPLPSSVCVRVHLRLPPRLVASPSRLCNNPRATA